MDIIGHTNVIKRLRELLRAGSLPHTLLFVGPRSVGKRRVADWLADKLAPKHPERIVVLSPEELRIDTVRSLRRLSALSAPAKAPYVVILDDVAHLSSPAANALLKTLEEPRGAVHFILIAHGDGTDLLPTIRSRSAIFRFSPVPSKVIARELQKKLNISEKQANALTQRAAGIPGRAILLHEGGNAKERELQQRFVEAIGNPLVDRFALVKEVVDNNESFAMLEQGLLFLRDVMLFQEGCDDLLMNDDVTNTEATARSLASERLREILRTMLTLESLIATSNVNRRLALEEAVLVL